MGKETPKSGNLIQRAIENKHSLSTVEDIPLSCQELALLHCATTYLLSI
jgi:hypothetical protein